MQKAYAKTVKGKQGDYATIPTETEKKELTAEVVVSRFKEFRCLSDQIANSKYFAKNWYYEGGKEAFPKEPSMWTVSRFYMYAAGSKLCVDEAKDLDEKKLLERKAPFVRKANMRYVCITNNMKLEDILFELEGN